MKIALSVDDLSAPSLRYAAQLGAQGVILDAALFPSYRERGAPAAEELAQAMRAVEPYGLRVLHLNLRPQHTAHILQGGPRRDREIEEICATVRAAGAAGLPSVFFNLTPWRSLPHAWSQYPGAPAPAPGDARLGSGPGRRYRAVGRGGAVLLTHTTALAAADAAAGPETSIAPYGPISSAQLWERIAYFYRAVVPAAEEAGVNVGSHPNDPPEPVYRGVEQNLNTPEGLQRLLDLAPSPRSGLLLCLGTLHEMCPTAAATLAALESFVRQGKVFSIHFRNPRGNLAGGYYQEDFLDRGDLDMLAVLRLLHRLGYPGSLDPDHAIGVEGDDPRGRIAFAWELGYMRALQVAVEGER